jgi:predicted Rossmann fold flavoprotein
MPFNQNKSSHFNTVIIGGGASGMMAAIWASQNDLSVALLEKNNSLGKKLLLTGNGRCNITQAKMETLEFIEKIGKNGRFLFSSLLSFGSFETINFFENLGLPLKTEKDGRVFPKSNSAKDVLRVLLKKLEKNKVKICLNQNVLEFEIKDKKMICAKTVRGKIYAKNFILSTGGKSFPVTGSTGDGYCWLKNLGHTIISPLPALSPLKTKENWPKELMGLSLENVNLAFIHNGRKKKLPPGKIIFTHFGLSGPAIINASRDIGKYLKNGNVFLEIDFLPAWSTVDLEKKIKFDSMQHPKKNLNNYLSEIFPRKFAEKILTVLEIETSEKLAYLKKTERKMLVSFIKNSLFSVESLLDFNYAMITSGGASLKEVDPKTMRSKIISNLFLTGEVLDLDGPTGGYNLQIAWTTGYMAGKSATEKID